MPGVAQPIIVATAESSVKLDYLSKYGSCSVRCLGYTYFLTDIWLCFSVTGSRAQSCLTLHLVRSVSPQDGVYYLLIVAFGLSFPSAGPFRDGTRS